MKIILVGDSCSGKTTILQMLQERGHPALLEEGWRLIPPEVERNKLQSNIWFTWYYFNRDRPFFEKNITLERCFHFQYPFTHAQFQTGKITVEERDEALRLLDTLGSALPLEENTIVIHLTCSPEQTWQRLQARGREQSPMQLAYWSLLRELTTRYFQPRSRYHLIDTTTKTPDEVCSEVLSILSQSMSQAVSETDSRRESERQDSDTVR